MVTARLKTNNHGEKFMFAQHTMADDQTTLVKERC
jgi:hypothetical protein